MALVAQFQGLCRGLHDEAVAVYVAEASVHQRDLVRTLLTQGRKLYEGNPRKSTLGADLGRLGFKLMDALKAEGAATEAALESLEQLVVLRNAIGRGNERQIDDIARAGPIKTTNQSFLEQLRILNTLAGTMAPVGPCEALEAREPF